MIFFDVCSVVASEYAYAEKAWFGGFFIPLNFMLNAVILLHIQSQTPVFVLYSPLSLSPSLPLSPSPSLIFDL